MKKQNFIKKAVATLLAMVMMVGMGSTVFAEGTSAGDVDGNFTSYTSINGEEFIIQDQGEMIKAPQVVGDPISEFEISPFNYHNDWTKVSSVTGRPYNGIVRVISTFTNGVTRKGTGFVVGDGKILTAAHNLYSNDMQCWIRSITVEFRRNGTSISSSVNTTQGSVPTGWLNVSSTDKSSEEYFKYDYGIIKVPTSYTSTATKFGLYSGVYSGTQYTISGYPHSGTFGTGTYMYTDSEYIQTDYGYTVRHSIDCKDGISGAPMYGSNIYAVGIQTKGFSNIANDSATDAQYGKGGYATPITSTVISFVNAA